MWLFRGRIWIQGLWEGQSTFRSLVSLSHNSFPKEVPQQGLQGIPYHILVISDSLKLHSIFKY